MSIVGFVMGGLALLNAAAVLIVMRGSIVPRRRVASAPELELDARPESEAASLRPNDGVPVSASGAAARPVEDGLVELVEEAERLECMEAGRLRGEARLAADLVRWRARGQDRPWAAGSCRAGRGP